MSLHFIFAVNYVRDKNVLYSKLEMKYKKEVGIVIKSKETSSQVRSYLASYPWPLYRQCKHNNSS